MQSGKVIAGHSAAAVFGFGLFVRVGGVVPKNQVAQFVPVGRGLFAGQKSQEARDDLQEGFTP